MNPVISMPQGPATPMGMRPAQILVPGATHFVMVEPGTPNPHPGLSPMAAHAGMYPSLTPQQPQPMMWGGSGDGIAHVEHGPSDVELRVSRDVGSSELGKPQGEGIEKPIAACACVPGFAAHERERCAHYDHWPTVWAGHHASFLSGYALLAFRVVFNVIPQFIICIAVILDRTWVDKQLQTKGEVVTDEQFKQSQEQYLFYLSNWTNVIQFFFFLHASAVTFVAIKKYDAGERGPVPCPLWVRVCWQTHSVAVQLSTVVVILYWYLLADPPFLAISIAQHGVNAILQIIDLLVVGTLVPVAHAVWVFLFALCYLVFSVIHWGTGTTNWAGSNYIYGVLDWNDPAAAGTLSALVLIFIPVIFPMLFALLSVARIRAFTKTKIPL
mmetsp:Transcript_3275/g.8406  ORF Transcript_3275/g.8406 Transcript_3275/m.8406 type:complete len:384 (-) Transcript_3275:118-1269(-)